MEAGQIDTRFRHQGGEARDKARRLEDGVDGAVAMRDFELIPHGPLPPQGYPVGGDGRAESGFSVKACAHPVAEGRYGKVTAQG